MNRLRWLGILFGCLFVVRAALAQSSLEADERTLKDLKVPTDGKRLIEFFVAQSPREGDEKDLAALVRKLGSSVYRIREPARKELVLAGTRALPFLRGALTSTASDAEAKRLAEDCIADIKAQTQHAPIAAAARVLAARKEPKAAEVLFKFLPTITDPLLEEDVLSCVGRLTITADKVDPLVLHALKDPLPFRRYTAAYLIGRRASADHRQQLRDLLADKDAMVSQRVAEGLFGKRPFQVLAEALPTDESLLKAHKMELTEAALLKYFRAGTPSADDQKKYRALVKTLGHNLYAKREQAYKKLEQAGVKVLPFLKEVDYKQAETESDQERVRRAADLMTAIRAKNDPAVPIAAAHLLAGPAGKKNSPGEAIRVLLAYIPFADDDSVEEEILTSLTMLSLREPAVEPELVKALSDRHPTRRAAAAFVLGHVGTKEQLAKVQARLDDFQPMVRLRAAQGLLAARNRAALPSFVSLIKSVPASQLPKIEETLYRLADDKGPSESITGDSPDKAVKAWKKWLDANQAKIDLTNLNDRESFLGLITVCEYDNQFNQFQQGQVSEGPRNGDKRWKFGGLWGAMDAHTLPNGRVLVAENNQNRVTERDTKGHILWEFRTPLNPVCCQRLPNGNTFIASYNMVMEVKPDKSEVYRIQSSVQNQFHIFSAYKAKNGHIVMLGAQNQIIEMDSKGTRLHTTPCNTFGNWCSVEMMPNGNYLVASMQSNSVKEINRNGGGEVWTKQFPINSGVFRATRLPNGNVIACCMNTRQVMEIERPSGNFRWQITTQGRPWAVHYR